MTAELAVVQPAPAEMAQTDPTGGRLVAWAQAASAAHQLAQSLSKTSFVPASFKGNPGDATAAVLMGDELGLSPLAALRSIFVIHGQPAMYARTMVALAQSHGHEVWTESSSDSEVTVCGRRRGSAHVERATWSLARAQKAGYTKNAKYQSNGQEMLYAKAAAEVARKIAADVLAGVPLSVEDLELEPAEAPPAPVTRMARRKAEPPPPVDPDLDPPTPEPGPADPQTPQQHRQLFVLLTEQKMTDRDDYLAFVRVVLDNDSIESTKDLSAGETDVVIAALKARRDRGQG